jgi:hypothetical protein
VVVTGTSTVNWFPVADKDAGNESAARINDWVAHMERNHPQTTPRIVADVVEWHGSVETHARELADLNRYIAEEEQEI